MCLLCVLWCSAWVHLALLGIVLTPTAITHDYFCKLAKGYAAHTHARAQKSSWVHFIAVQTATHFLKADLFYEFKYKYVYICIKWHVFMSTLPVNPCFIGLSFWVCSHIRLTSVESLVHGFSNSNSLGIKNELKRNVTFTPAFPLLARILFNFAHKHSTIDR